MNRQRRAFLKATGLAAAVAAAGLPTARGAMAQAPSPPSPTRGAGEPKSVQGLVFATLRRPSGSTLGIRTDRGILDVAAAERDFRERRRPPSRRASRARAMSRGWRGWPRRRGRAPGRALFRRPRQGRVRTLRDPSGEDPLHRPQLPQARRRDEQRRCPTSRSCSTSSTPRSTATAASSRVSKERRRAASTTRPSW